MTKKFDYLILGAGYGGLSAAAYLAQAGAKLAVLEAHQDIAGCAGRFKRKHTLFDAGATTLSGVKFNGPLKKIIHDLGLHLELEKADPGIIFQFNQQKLRRFSDFEKWIDELERVFPHLEHREVWTKIEHINQKAWEVLPYIHGFPITSFKDLYSLMTPYIWKSISLAPYITKSFLDLFDNKSKNDPLYRQFLDEMLMISTQSKAHQVNALIGSLGASYPSDTWIPMGGMSALADQLVSKIKENHGEIHLRSKVARVEKNENGFKVTTQKGLEFFSDQLISNIPYWNHAHIGPDEFTPQVKVFDQNHPDTWSALSAYTTIKFNTSLEGYYHQIHLEAPLAYTQGKSIFLSFSSLKDKARAKEGYHALTVSTHAHKSDWDCPTESAEYKERKKNLAAEIEKILRQYFNNKIEELDQIEIGTPHTFEKYTGRKNGRVGGLPHRGLKTLLMYPSYQTGIKGFYRVGDTIFPGQGVVGVITGAQKLCFELLKGKGDIKCD